MVKKTVKKKVVKHKTINHKKNIKKKSKPDYKLALIIAAVTIILYFSLAHNTSNDKQKLMDEQKMLFESVNSLIILIN